MRRDARENGRIILAHGELTGHCHEVVLDVPSPTIDPLQFFEEPDGTRVLLVLEPGVLTHQEHDHFRLAPDGRVEKIQRVTGEILQSAAFPCPVRQGDVYLRPLGPGAWSVTRQREGYQPDGWRQVAD